MRKIKLSDPRPSIERPVDDPKKAMERARRQVRAERKRRAHFLITLPARRRASAQETTHLSGLQRRIAEGLADPISDLEREQLRQLEQIYVRRFGKKPGGRRDEEEPEVRPAENTVRRVPSPAEKRIAARILVRTDRALKLETPQWIKDLAKAP